MAPPVSTSVQTRPVVEAPPPTPAAAVEETLPPPLNRALLDDLRALEREGVPGMVVRMIDAYMGTAPASREELLRAIDAEDAESLRKAAHSLKSSSGNLGAGRLSDFCRKLEEIGRSGSTKQAAELLDDFQAEYARVEAALLAEKQQDAQ